MHDQLQTMPKSNSDIQDSPDLAQSPETVDFTPSDSHFEDADTNAAVGTPTEPDSMDQPDIVEDNTTEQDGEPEPASHLSAEALAQIASFTTEPKEDEEPQAKTPAEIQEERSDVFPPNVYSSASVRGARNKLREDPDGLDLRIEGLLFVTDVPLTIKEISIALEVDKDKVRETIRYMIKSFARRRSALELRERIRRGQPAFVIDLKPQYRPDVKPIATPALPRRFIQTLALIALNQPLAQSRLVRELGSKVYDHVRELVERGLVSKHKKGLSYSLKTTQRFSSEFGVSNNSRDLRTMLARKMTEDERRDWDEYQRFNAPPAVQKAEEYEDAIDVAANQLTSEAISDHIDDGPAVIALDEASAPLGESAELSAPSWTESPVAPVASEPRTETVSQPIDPSKIKDLGRIESDRANRDQYAPEVDEETVGRPLTRFEKLFMQLQKRK